MTIDNRSAAGPVSAPMHSTQKANSVSAPATEEAVSIASERKFNLGGAARELALLPAIAATIVLGSFLSPFFLTVNNLVNNVLVTSAVLGMVVLAEAVILIAGKFDLSLESIVGLAPMFAVWLVLPSAAGGGGFEFSPWVAIPAMFLLAAAIGLFNGAIVSYLKLNAFIVTLATLILMRGVTVGLAGGQTLSGLPDAFKFLGTAKPLGLSIQVWIFVGAFVLAAAFMKHHPTGRRLYALGGNEAAAAAAGIRTRRLTIGAFVFGALIAAFAGLMLTGRIASVASNQGENLIFTVFAAAVIGGISLEGGKGSMFGAMSGVVLLGLIQNLLVLSQVKSYWIEAFYGGIILAALVLNYVVSKARTRAQA
ncbi:ABC transporter permease [Nocardioides sp. NBC_00850]|uniref:ABC transporter permease n=1 Tax=Nocardioides sp. NBC_00850 TaxID=2976001 RepID=UPI00386319C5|nr:ABC transporter permease [Nocardioides sp. NBC_00850]